MQGSIKAPDTILTSGVIEGDIKANIIIVEVHGAIRGTVCADTLDIAGSAKDNLTANMSLIVRATGNINGTISYSEMTVERGGKMGGTLLVLEGNDLGLPSIYKSEGEHTSIDTEDDASPSY
jgi:cytoskeletal protein CcmA (bactofilin family)